MNAIPGQKYLSYAKTFDARSSEQKMYTIKKFVSFSATQPIMTLVMPVPLLSVKTVKVEDMVLANPFLRVTPANSGFFFYVLTGAQGGTDQASLLASSTKYWVLIDIGSYSAKTLVATLNDRIASIPDWSGEAAWLQFSYDEASSTVSLSNTHATRTVYLPSNAYLAEFTNIAGVNDSVGSVLPTLGMCVPDVTAVEMRASGHRVSGLFPAYDAAASNVEAKMSRSTEAVKIARSTETATSSSISAQIPVCMPYELLFPSAANLAMAENLGFLQATCFRNKKMLFLTTELSTNHYIASSNQINNNPTESQANISGVLAKIPVNAVPGGQLTQIFSVPIDAHNHPFKRIDRLKLKLIDQDGELVDLRGHTMHCTISFVVPVF